MNKHSENKCDRELFSELLEPQIHPLLIHIVPPFIEENNPVFYYKWTVKQLGDHFRAVCSFMTQWDMMLCAQRKFNVLSVWSALLATFMSDYK